MRGLTSELLGNSKSYVFPDDIPKLKLNNDKTESLFVGSSRRVSMSQDNHLRVGSHDISFKHHVKNLEVYIDATLSVVKHY